MTAIVGIKCKDGIVIGADSCATFTRSDLFPTIEQEMDKLEIVAEQVIIAGTGEVGLGQRFRDVVESSFGVQGFSLNQDPLKIALQWSELALRDRHRTLGQFSAVNEFQGYGAIVAYPSQNQKQPALCQFQYKGFQPELMTKLWYGSMGCAQHITDAFLAFLKEVFWKQDIPNLWEGILAAYWTLQHVIDINTGMIRKPIRIAVLEFDENQRLHARQLPDTELDEYRQDMNDAIRRLRDFQADQRNHTAPELPTP